jgi:uracil-DNA glycosylase
MGPCPVSAPSPPVYSDRGLAPGLQGANRTGRPFTGDWAGDLLYDTLLKLGLAKGQYEERIDDTLELVIAASPIRCAACRRRTSPSRRKSRRAASS